MNCIIVDDDEMSRLAVASFVKRVQFMNLEGMYNNVYDARRTLENKKIDLMFLDIEMPEIDGITFLRSLRNAPLTIIISAKKEYALEAFECDVVDYLTKPLLLDRFFTAAGRAKEFFDLNQNMHGAIGKNHVFVKSNGILTKLDIKEIMLIEARGDYVVIHTAEKNYTIHSTMKAIENNLDPEKFIRVHRSYIVSIDKITSMKKSVLSVNRQIITVGPAYKKLLSQRLSVL